MFKLFEVLHGEQQYKFSFVEKPRKFAIAKFSIRELGSYLVLIMHYYILAPIKDPNSRIERFAIINLRGVSTKLNLNTVFVTS